MAEQAKKGKKRTSFLTMLVIAILIALVGVQLIHLRSQIDDARSQLTALQSDLDTAKQETGTEVKLNYVVGLLYDRRALATVYMQDSVYTTPFNTKGEYYNTEHHWKMNYMQDPTENAILFFMNDEP